MIKKSRSIKKKYSTKLVNQDNVSYFGKPKSQTNPIDTKEKENKYKTKFSTISILKMKLTKTNFKKKS
jgi:hypothetical protein